MMVPNQKEIVKMSEMEYRVWIANNMNGIEDKNAYNKFPALREFCMYTKSFVSLILMSHKKMISF